MESHGAWLHKKPSLMFEIKLREQESAHNCIRKCVEREIVPWKIEKRMWLTN